MGNIRTIGDQQLYRGDCLQIMRQLPKSSIDAVVTSPPYNLNVAYNSYNDKQPQADYLSWMLRVAKRLRRLLKPEGSIFLNINGSLIDPVTYLRLALSWTDIFTLQNSIIWAKSVTVGGKTHGPFRPINSKRFLNHTHEAIFHFTKSGSVALDRLAIGVPFTDKSNISRFGHAQDKRCAGNIWFIPYSTVTNQAGKFNHPAGFPVELPERCLRLVGKPGIVLDPFMGTGTTLIAAARNGWQGIGIEMDKEYWRTAIKRLK